MPTRFIIRVILGFASATNCISSAHAWTHDGISSGMTEEQAYQALVILGHKNIMRMPVANNKRQVFLRGGSRDKRYDLTLCDGFLTELIFDVGGGFKQFAALIEQRKAEFGPPSLSVRYFELSAWVSATWQKGEDTTEFSFEVREAVDYGTVSFGLKVSSKCDN